MEKEQIQNIIKELIEKITLESSQVVLIEDKGNNIWFSIQVSEPHLFTKQDGEAIYALNHLVRRMIETNKQTKDTLPPSILIDINDFQKKKIDSIRAIAHMMSERARYFKSNIEVDPMPAFERRIVHEFLSDAPDLKTESLGFGPSRRVVIKYIGAI